MRVVARHDTLSSPGVEKQRTWGPGTRAPALVALDCRVKPGNDKSRDDWLNSAENVIPVLDTGIQGTEGYVVKLTTVGPAGLVVAQLEKLTGQPRLKPGNNGQKTLRRIARRLWLICAFTLWPFVVSAGAPVFTGDFVQGGLVHGTTQPGTAVEFLGRKVRVDQRGRFVIGFGRDFAKTAPLYWSAPNGPRQSLTLKIKARRYRTQKIDGLPSKMVTPPKTVLDRIRRENRGIAAVRRLDSATPWHESGFNWPLQGRISGVYGSQRILNGKPKRPHYGLDIANKTGTPVHASTDGMVALAESDLYYTGGTVMLDHGHGLTSVYSHLHTVAVKRGQFVRQGQAIGTLGMTGRATGPHLDWRLNWFKQRLDPALLLGAMPGG